MPRYIRPFTPDQLAAAEIEVKRLVRALQGRKLEEGDWTDLYCQVKGAPSSGWSNLPFRDYLHDGVGVEFKLLCRDVPEQDMGRALMHPSATRTINFDENDSAAGAARAVLQQWGAQIDSFRQRVMATSSSRPQRADLRWGVLLWAPDHSQFLYFEEELEVPDPSEHEGRWVDGSHRGKPTRNLHIFKDGRKRYSCTLPRNGAKLQPYFDVPTVEQGAVLFKVTSPTTVPFYVERTDLARMKEMFPDMTDEEVAARLLAFYLEHGGTASPDVILGNPPYVRKPRGR